MGIMGINGNHGKRWEFIGIDRGFYGRWWETMGIHRDRQGVLWKMVGNDGNS
jgi:hypothetical protein